MKIIKTDLLLMLYFFCIAVSELLGAKTFPLVNILGYQLNASVAIFVVPVIFSVNDMVIEVYGVERARSMVRAGLLMVFLIMLFSMLATILPPSSRFSSSEQAYDKIFGLSARIAAASLTAFAVANFLDVAIFAKLKERMKKHALWFRNNASNFISQFVDTVVFMTLAFYSFDKGISVNATFLFSIILPYWLLKSFMSIIETPFVYLGVKWLKKD